MVLVVVDWDLETKPILLPCFQHWLDCFSRILKFEGSPGELDNMRTIWKQSIEHGSNVFEHFAALIWLLSQVGRWASDPHSETQHVSCQPCDDSARKWGQRIDQWEGRLPLACALIGRELCVTRGDRCGRVLAAILVVRRTLDSVHCVPPVYMCVRVSVYTYTSITSTASQYWAGLPLVELLL